MKRALALGLFAFAALSAPNAHAVPCPGVVIVLDRSGSMDITDGTNPKTRWEIANDAIMTLMMEYADKLPFGFVTYQNSGSCDDFSQEATIPPKPKNGAAILAKLASLGPDGSTNTGQGVKKGGELISNLLMSEPDRPGGYVILITDGEPNCPGSAPAPTAEPAYTVYEIDQLAQDNIKTFVVGFGQLDASSAMKMNQMAMAGGAPCMGAQCAGKSYYAADTPQSLDEALTAIQGQISGEFGMQCDDSCYANGCPNAGEICAQSKCVPDPCLQVQDICAKGDYCYTDGSTSGTCVKACLSQCAAGQVCDTSTGKCKTDPCGMTSCPQGTVCANGNCVSNDCPDAGCDPGLICYGGQCVDDPCRYIADKCPMGTTCQSGTGACIGTGPGGTGPGGACRVNCPSSCSTTTVPATVFSVLIIGLALAYVSRRRRLS